MQLIRSAVYFVKILAGGEAVRGIEPCELSSRGAAWSSVCMGAVCSGGPHPEQDQEQGNHRVNPGSVTTRLLTHRPCVLFLPGECIKSVCNLRLGLCFCKKTGLCLRASLVAIDS